MATSKRPVRDSGLPKPTVPFHAGGRKQATSKSELADTGTIGFVPGHGGTGRGSTLRAGYVHEAPLPPADGSELEPARQPMPREQPVYSFPSHTGTITRFADGHSEVHRERPGLVELLGNPHVHPDDKEDIRAEIAMRDGIHNHMYW